jgi:hypothetical protein
MTLGRVQPHRFLRLYFCAITSRRIATMKMEYNDLAYRNAQKHVKSYSDESSLMKAHAEAMDCRYCEAFLQMGIDAFHWLIRADRVYRTAVYRGEIEYSADFEKMLAELCEQWLGPCEAADGWIEKQLTEGFTIDNLDEFRECAEEMLAIVESAEPGDNQIPESVAALQDAAVEEYRNGQTAEFI